MVLTEKELLEELNSWKQKEGRKRESSWLEEGASLYRQLLDIKPQDKTYKKELAEILVRLGLDEKMVYVNHLKAKEIFEEVLELDPKDIDALYRLGHVNVELRNWNESIRLFEKALECEIDLVKEIRVYCALAEAFYHIGEKEDAKFYVQKAELLDVGKDYSADINKAKMIMDGNRGPHVYQNGYVHANVREKSKEEILDAVLEKEEAFLDLDVGSRGITGPIDTIRLEKRETEIIKLLVDYPRIYFSRPHLAERVWENSSVKDSTIKSAIFNVRSKLRKAFGEDCIETKRGQGYRWSSSVKVNTYES